MPSSERLLKVACLVPDRYKFEIADLKPGKVSHIAPTGNIVLQETHDQRRHRTPAAQTLFVLRPSLISGAVRWLCPLTFKSHKLL